MTPQRARVRVAQSGTSTAGFWDTTRYGVPGAGRDEAHGRSRPLAHGARRYA